LRVVPAVTLEEIGNVLAAHNFLGVKESFVSDFTIKINRDIESRQAA
jgi:hypothetical protein